MGTSGVNGNLWGTRANDWAELQERTAQPLYVHALRETKVGRGVRYLDVGCGAGLAAQLAAQQGADVSGLDASEALLAVARARVPAGDFRVGELEELPFEAGHFDVVTGFNSFQYAASPVRALGAAKRVVKAGGLVVIATWSPAELTDASALLAALKPLLPPPPPGAPGPFALSDEKALRALVTEAGLTALAVHDVSCPFEYPSLDVAVRALDSSGVAVKAAQHSGGEAVSAAHRAAATRFTLRDGSVRVPNQFRYLLARA